MPRTLTSDMLAALAAPFIQPSIFVQMAFKTQTAYLWSGVGNLTWNSHTWLGVGSLMSISSIEDSSTVEAKGISVVLSGLDATLLPEALTDFQLGLPATIYLALWSTTSSATLVNTPLISWAGRTDQPSLDVSGTEATITINCETRLLDMDTPVDRRYTNDDCQMSFPGDLGFSFVNSIQEKNLFFGFPNTSTNL